MLLLDNIFSDLEPQLLSKDVVILRSIRVGLCEFQISFVKCQIYTILIQSHLGVYKHTSLSLSIGFAQT